MKNPWEWDENDLLDMVKAGTQESIELDFKESGSLQATDKKKDDISKDVSAFANSAGGTIIYGMTEDKVTHVATGLDTGSNPAEITKEWLEQVINSKIHRRIDGVRIRQIELTTTHPGKVAYIVYVPSSTRAPHQAADKRFYKRFNFQSVPMEEYEIRDVSHRGEVPDLRIEFALPKTAVIMNQETGMSEPFGLNGGIFNDALEPANYAIIRIFIDARLKLEQAHDFTVREGVGLVLGDNQHPVTVLNLNWSIPGKMPIFQQAYKLNLTRNGEPFLLRTPTNGWFGKHASYLVGYEIGSPRMPIKSAYTLLHVKSGKATLSDEYLSIEELIAKYDKLVF